MAKLGEICKKASSAIKQSDLEGKEGIYPIYGASGLIKNVNFYVQEKPYVAVVKDGAGIGRVFCLPEKSSVIGTMQYIIPNDNTDVKYLAYAMEHMNLSKYYTGATIPHIYFKDYCNESLKNHSLSEQKKIADMLDKIDRLINCRKQQLAKLGELVKARFVEMFGDLAAPSCEWDKCHLVETCANSDDIKCGPFGTQLGKEEYTKTGVAVWEIPQINTAFGTAPTHFITQKKAEQLSAYSITSGDIAMSRKGNVGKCAIFPSEFPDGIIHSDVLRIRTNPQITNSIFMMYQLHYSDAVTHQIESVSSGAIMAGVNVTKLKQIFVHVPPLDLQNQFAAFVQQIDKSKLTVQQSLDKLEVLKKKLMQEYFG